MSNSVRVKPKKIGDDCGDVRQDFDISNPRGFDDVSVRVQVGAYLGARQITMSKN
jgi:hypothetical protein